MTPGRSLSFDPVADDYDATRTIPPTVAADVARLCVSLASLKRGGLFLDAGVGTGRFAAPLAALLPHQIVGVDISLAMMARAHSKAPALALMQADLQRLPFGNGTLAGALVVHILHLVEAWPLVLNELRRTLVPGGVLLLGAEAGGRSPLVDYYFKRARMLNALPPSVGTPGLKEALAFLRQNGAHVDAVTAPYLSWVREMTPRAALDALRRRTYSQLWSVPEDAHRLIMADCAAFAVRTYADWDAPERLPARFLLHAVRYAR